MKNETETSDGRARDRVPDQGAGGTVLANVRKTIELRRKAERAKGLPLRATNAVSNAVGSWTSAVAHAAVVAAYVVANLPGLENSRDELALQVGLLTELEATKALRAIDRVARRLGVSLEDEGLEELKRETSPEDLVRAIESERNGADAPRERHGPPA